MKFTSTMTDGAALAEIGSRIASVRLARGLTQAALAEEAGVSLRTVSRLEAGAAATHLTAVLRVLRVLGLFENLEQLLPEPLTSPIEELEREGSARKRARFRKQQDRERGTWTWGEDE